MGTGTIEARLRHVCRRALPGYGAVMLEEVS